MAASPPHVTSSTDFFGQVCTLLLQMPSQHQNCVQEAATFSRLLCVSQSLRRVLRDAAIGCVDAVVPAYHSCSKLDQSMVRWLTKHLALGTLRSLQVEADDFSSFSAYLYLCLAQQLQDGSGGRRDEETPSVSPLAGGEDAGAVIPPAAVDSGAVVTSAVALGQHRTRRLPKLLISWHVGGLPPSTLKHLPGAILTHLSLRSSSLSADEVHELGRLRSLRQLLLPNLNPQPASLAHALAALTCLTQLFIRHPFPPEQAALAVSLQQLVVSQQTPPWVQAAVVPLLEPLSIAHLTELTSLAVAEHSPQGITQQYALPTSLQHVAAVCVSAAGPLLGLKHLRTLQLSSLRHSPPEQLLQLSRLSLSAVQVGSDESAGVARLSFADLRAYVDVFAALPMAVTGLTVKQHAAGEDADRGICAVSVRALSHLTSLQSLSLYGCVLCRGLAVQHAASDAVTPVQLATALAVLPALKILHLGQLQLLGGDGVGAAGSSSHHVDTADAAAAGSAAAPIATSSSSSSSSSTTGSLTPAVVWACERDWRPAMAVIAGLPSLRRLSCKQLPLGTAAQALTAAVRLQDLGLHDCDIPLSVVNHLIQQLGANNNSTGSSSSSAGCRGVGGGGATTPSGYSEHAGSMQGDGVASNGESVAGAAFDRRSSVAYLCPGGCLTCLRFSRH